MRLHSLDIARGFAVVLMVLYHELYNLNFLEVTTIPLKEGIWQWMALFVQIIFVGSTGMTAVLRHKKQYPLVHELYHGLRLLGLGMVISFVTYLLFGDLYVRFGILHFMGVAVLFSMLFLPAGRWNLLIGALLLSTTPFLISVITSLDFPLLLILVPITHTTLDYFPLFPWFGLFLLGVGGMYSAYPLLAKKAVHQKPPRSLQPFAWLGKHSLLIYLVHQPVLFFGSWLVLRFF